MPDTGFRVRVTAMGERVLSISVEEFRRLSTGRRARVHASRPPRTARPPERESELPLRFTLPFLPPGINKLFATVRDDRSGATIRVLSARARRFRKLVSALVRGSLTPGQAYTLHVDVFLPAFT